MRKIMGWFGAEEAASAAEQAVMVCQELLEQVRIPVREVRKQLKAAVAQYAAKLREVGEDVSVPRSFSCVELLSWLAADAERRLSSQRPSVADWTLASTAVPRFLEGDGTAWLQLQSLEAVVVLAAAARETALRGGAIAADLDDDGADFASLDSKAERSRKRRQLAAVATCSNRSKLLFVTLANFEALCLGDDPRYTTYDDKRHDATFSNLSSASTESIDSARPGEESDGHEDAVDVGGCWRTESYEDFLADRGPISF